MNRHLSPLVDVVNFSGREPRRSGGRTLRILWHRQSGAIQHRPIIGRMAFSQCLPNSVLLKRQIAAHADDLYGTVMGPSQRNAKPSSISSLPLASTVAWWLRASWRGFAKAYCYSIVAWNPDNENQLYAAPNKFFEPIADGIPRG
jgi:hypothetical protein